MAYSYKTYRYDLHNVYNKYPLKDTALPNAPEEISEETSRQINVRTMGWRGIQGKSLVILVIYSSNLVLGVVILWTHEFVYSNIFENLAHMLYRIQF